MKKRIILVLSLLIFISISSLYIINHNRSLASFVEENNKGTLAIMVYDESTSDYIKQDTVPQGRYKINKEKTHCVGSDEIPYYNPESGTITYALGVADQCYMYFDKAQEVQTLSLGSYLNEAIISQADRYSSDYSWGIIDEYGYRYEGADPDNYVCFDEACTDGKFRMIGVFETDYDKENANGLLDATEYIVKLIRDEIVIYDKWNIREGGLVICNIWKDSTVRVYLNEDFYLGLTENLKNFVVTARYYLGGVAYDDTPYDFYFNERKPYINSANFESSNDNVALIYGSDYLYAVLHNTCPRSTTRHNYMNLGCYDKNWLYINDASPYWTISVSPLDSGGNVAFRIAEDGRLIGGIDLDVTNHGIRPTFYVHANTKVLSGTGIESDPYILGL